MQWGFSKPPVPPVLNPPEYFGSLNLENSVGQIPNPREWILENSQISPLCCIIISVQKMTCTLVSSFDMDDVLPQAFSKGSPLVEKVSNEILMLRESGKLRKLEEQILVSSPSKSLSSETNSQDHDNGRLSPDSFSGLFLITGGTSTLAFLLFRIGQFLDKWCLKKQQHQDQQVTEKDHIIILVSPSKRAAHMVKGNQAGA